MFSSAMKNMIINERIKIFDKNCVFLILLLSIINLYACLNSIFWYIDWISFLIFINKITTAAGFFFNFVNIFYFTGNFMSLKSSLFEKSLSFFVILAGLRSPGCKYLTKHHLKHPLSSAFQILINPFLGWSDTFANFI